MTPPTSVLRWRPFFEKYAAMSVQAPYDDHIIQPIGLWQYPASTCQEESTGDPDATNPDDPSWGLMGITGFIARAYGGITTVPSRNPDPETWNIKPLRGYDGTHILFDPETNIKIGTAFLADLKMKHAAAFPLVDASGNVNPIAFVAAYNEGEVAEAIKHIPDPKYVAAFVSHLKDLQAMSA
jgi:hypothetical protein